MLDEAEYASDTDESDEDYKPDAGGENALSEVESDDELQNVTETKRGSRKRTSDSPQPSNMTKRNKPSTHVEQKSIEKDELDDDDDDDNEDALWASFLGNSTQTKTVNQKTNPKQKENQTIKTPTNTKITKPHATTTKMEETKLVTQIFDFAGEKVEIQKEIKVNDETSSATTAESKTEESSCSQLTTKSKPISTFNKPRTSGGGGGGLSSVLGQLGKKNKLSILAKSQLDWTGFKRAEGIDEELQTHNKGRDGFLERQDFLQRTDLRQFEIEKSLRQANRRK